ncbi:uncharacterized protein LOC129777482 [Toxorhynchites rutilus septentrionalis]|uniref:uncharacterized protein LOC129777482 n=1 Tax=Toxorhynchites rutilus septentrionalis TaxID=329112 RepID=UPI00247ACAA0|nr:uncharacterized protein LOC129777482 [Toxorhynchites rutilus septentrionalis]XP_055639737.1 uncharacterized protein LOC129777482 [Toxorhynchites rutilus septentrionalis]XP_055639738.1 uncharacterized protein LOC129777482 [Toxorhynchites rutilus septentrionalis]
MLKPLKTLLTYLQRNANSSSIFGLTNGMGPTEEPTLDANEIMASDELNCEDPLYDPLALDGCDTDLNLSNASVTTIGSAVGSEPDSSSTGKITLVDVTSLKGSSTTICLKRDYDCSEDGVESVENGTSSVVNGHDDSGMSLENGHNDETKSQSSAVLEDETFIAVESCVDGNVVIDGQSSTEAHELSNVRQAIGESTTKAATATESSSSTQPNEEEEASDGSDSGLGSEPPRTALNQVKSNLKRHSSVEATGASSEKRPKRAITFDGVTVYYFTRMQGFGCVPSQGGCTLGMEFQHMHSKRFTLAEHAAEQRKMHRAQLQELNPRSSSSEETDSEEEPSESGSEAESESYGFLQPVTTRQRRALLKAAGVRKIDTSEKDECRVIRTSREVCGCTCRGYCDPDTCACSQAGIKCQVDRPNFPCGCTQDGCANVVGRVEFNPARVRTHFIHTIMRLNLDHKANNEDHNVMGMHSVNSYGSGKDWSSGPVRLPGLYGMVGVNGAESLDGYHHHLQQQQHQYGANHSYLAGHSVSNAIPPNSDSLDLHYAFRDYYGAAQHTNDQLAMSNPLMTSYYGNYSTNMDQYHQPHHSSLVIEQRQPEPHSSYQGQMESAPSSSAIIDEEATLNTPINPNFNYDDQSAMTDIEPSISEQPVHETILPDQQQSPDTSAPSCNPDHNSSSETVAEAPATVDPQVEDRASSLSPQSGDFIDLNTPLTAGSDRLVAINDLLASSRHAANLAKQSIIAEEDDELSDFRDLPVMALPSVVNNSEEQYSINSSDTQPEEVLPEGLPQNAKTVQTVETSAESSSHPSDVLIETSENLSEIIKNSIVQTVSN